MKNRKVTGSKWAVVLFNSGLGDGLQTLPLWKELKKQGWQLTGLFGASYLLAELIKPLGIFENIHPIRNHADLWKFVLSNIQGFQCAYLDYHSSSAEWSLAACLLARKAITNREKWYLRLLPNLRIKPVFPGAHNIHQNLSLAVEPQLLPPLEEIYRLKFPSEKMPSTFQWLSGDYVVIQISAANNEVDYKNWPLEYWAWFLSKLACEFTNLKFVLVGDKNEVRRGEMLQEMTEAALISCIGKTTLMELAALVGGAKMYLGLDSGTMHLAAMMGVPTFTIWGPTDPLTIGYQVVNETLHKDVVQHLSCHPCYSAIRPNYSEVTHPQRCPHQRCIKSLQKELVWQEFQHHWWQIPQPKM